MSRPRRSVIAKVLLALVVAVVAGAAGYLLTTYVVGRVEVAARFVLSDDVLTSSAALPVYRAAPRQDDVLRDVLERIGREASPEALAELRERIAVDVATDAAGRRVLDVRVPAPSEPAAADLADALAAALLAWDRGGAAERVRQRLAALDRRVDALTDEIRALQVLGFGDAGPLIAERETVIAERDRAVALLAAGESVRSLEVVDVSVVRMGPRPIWNAVLAGTIAGILVLLLQLPLTSQATERGARSAGRRRPEASVGALSRFPRASRLDDPGLLSAATTLASAILGRTIDERPLVFVVTGTDGGVGATTVACLLAEELTRRGRRTLLVDGDLAAPDVAARYRTRDSFAGEAEAASTVAWLRDPERARGFASVRLSGGVTLDLTLQPRPTRPAPGSEEAFFSALPEAIERWSGYQTVVIDSGPILTLDDTRWLARAATATLLVVRGDGEDERRVRAAHGLLREVGASLLGRVENDAPPDATSDGAVEEESDLRVVPHGASSSRATRSPSTQGRGGDAPRRPS